MEFSQQEKLGISEFEEVLFDNISKVIVNRSYLKENSDFWDDVVFKLYEEYTFGKEDLSIRQLSKVLEIFMSFMFKHKPSQVLPKDILDFS